VTHHVHFCATIYRSQAVFSCSNASALLAFLLSYDIISQQPPRATSVHTPCYGLKSHDRKQSLEVCDIVNHGCSARLIQPFARMREGQVFDSEFECEGDDGGRVAEGFITATAGQSWPVGRARDLGDDSDGLGDRSCFGVLCSRRKTVHDMFCSPSQPRPCVVVEGTTSMTCVVVLCIRILPQSIFKNDHHTVRRCGNRSSVCSAIVKDSSQGQWALESPLCCSSARSLGNFRS
jgi:hypothetical protein